jgi:hypothetical protein
MTEPLGPSLSVAALREALSNAARQARASHVQVTVEAGADLDVVGTACLELRADNSGQVGKPAGVAPFVVVPAEDLREAAGGL